ncbi:9984_t:CDS:2 [Acaulospora morrowiae]|uniref:9984_t:CDS:1 n=1 Tax=Acaulospora morrowiae TaxID=94023 RepID=A0A9N9CUI6_9GLOM|nr:9984_t:CDS:2 [Acaulospora morrowiae]
MSVELEPSLQLPFHRPFTQLVKEILVVRNPNTQPVAFKVKTTAPKQYCVRPNSGRIEANQSVEVQVILQPMKEDPPPDFKCKDKFLVQSIAITPERETLSLQELWSITEKEAKESIKENKIRCVYLPPVTPAANNLPSASPPSNLSLSPQTPVPARPSSPSSPLDSSIYSEADKTINHLSSPPPYSSNTNDSNKTTVSAHTDNVPTSRGIMNGHSTTISSRAPGSFPKDHEDHIIKDEPAKLRRQLLEAQEEIKRLSHSVENYKQELNTAQMRQRKNDESISPSNRHSISGVGGYSVNVQERIPEGYYPFEVVVGAAVGAFLFGVMFF